MKRMLAPLLLTLLAANAGGCSGADVPDVSEATAALEAHRYHEARAAFQAIRQDEGVSEANSLQLAQVMIGLGDGYVAERYLTEIADQPTRFGSCRTRWGLGAGIGSVGGVVSAVFDHRESIAALG